MSDQTQDVGMIKHLVHLYLRLCILTPLTVVTKDPLQGIEVPILYTLNQIDITEPTENEQKHKQ